VAGAAAPIPASLEGLDLTPLWQGHVPAGFAQRYLYGEAPGGLNWEPVVSGIAPLYRSIRQGRFKLVERVKKGADYALYDLSLDPGEQADVRAEHGELAARLRAELQARAAAIDAASERKDAVELDPEEAARLRALGYVVP
jgi:hypothetical protein